MARLPPAVPVLEGRKAQPWSYLSPDGEWHAQVAVRLPIVDGVSLGEDVYTRFIVTRRHEKVEWVVVGFWLTYRRGLTAFRWPTPETIQLVDRDDLCWQLGAAHGELARWHARGRIRSPAHRYRGGYS